MPTHHFYSYIILYNQIIIVNYKWQEIECAHRMICNQVVCYGTNIITIN